MNRKIKFSECVQYMIKGPFGSDMKKSLYVPKGEDTYKVYVQGNAIQKDETLGDYYVSSEYFHQKLERFEVHSGDYIITCDGTLGKFIKLSDEIEQGVISSSLLLLKLDEEVIYDKYFEILWEHSMLRHLASQARNACLVHLPSAKAIGDVEIELPSMEVQKKLADTAFKIISVLDSRKVELNKLDALIKARFVEMFGDPIINSKNLGTKALKDIMTLKAGDFTAASDIYDEKTDAHPYPCYGGNGIRGYVSDYNQEGEYSLVGRQGALSGNVQFACGRFKNTEHALLVTPIAKMNNIWLNQLLLILDLKRYQTGAAQPGLSVKNLQEIPIICVATEAQNSFADFVKQVDKSKVVVQEALDIT